MSNDFQNVTSGLGVLKRYYHGPIVNQLNNEVPIWRASQAGKHQWSGNVVRRPVRLRRNPGVGATSDGGVLPKIGRQTTAQAEISAMYNYLRFGITGPMLAASQSSVGSFVRIAGFEIENGMEDLKNDINRQLSWDGTGDLARVNSAAVASASLSVKGREDTEAALKFLDVGMELDVIDSSGSIVQSGVEITAISGGISDSTATLTVSPVVTASENNILVRSGSVDASGNFYEIQGLLTQLDGGTDTVFGINRSTYIQFQGNQVDLAGGQLDLDSMQEVEDECRRRGGAKLDALWTDFASQRFYQKLLTPDKRYSNTVKGDGSFSNKGESYLEWGGKPVVPDKDCPTRMFFLEKKHLVKYVQKELQFAEETGSIYIAQAESDEMEARLRFFANFFNEKPSASGVLTNYVSP